MPARFTLTKLPEKYEFKGAFMPRYNMAPKQFVYVILNSEHQKVVKAIFGFKRDFASMPLINARSEYIEDNKVFSDSFRNRRCLVLADSFYEWENHKGEKIPYRIMLKSEEVFGMAGVYEERKGEIYVSVLTCEPNKLIKKIHPRMPVILEEKNWGKWFNSKEFVFTSFDESKMKMYIVNSKVNNVINDDKSLIQEYIQKNKSLFDY